MISAKQSKSIFSRCWCQNFWYFQKLSFFYVQL